MITVEFDTVDELVALFLNIYTLPDILDNVDEDVRLDFEVPASDDGLPVQVVSSGVEDEERDTLNPVDVEGSDVYAQIDNLVKAASRDAVE